VQTILGNYVSFDVRVLWHFLILPRIAVSGATLYAAAFCGQP
jgi:hypothetical protein